MPFKITATHVSLATAIIGIALLFLFQAGFEAKEIKIGEITQEKIGMAFVTKGRVNWFGENEKTIFFELNDGNKIFVLKANPGIEERALVREKKFLKITGKIDSYKKQLEILAEKIEEAE